MLRRGIILAVRIWRLKEVKRVKIHSDARMIYLSGDIRKEA